MNDIPFSCNAQKINMLYKNIINIALQAYPKTRGVQYSCQRSRFDGIDIQASLIFQKSDTLHSSDL